MFTAKNYLIIGASSGIGLEMTRLLSEQGAFVFAFSRNPLPEPLPGVVWQSLDATRDELPAASLPERLDGFVYCPGSINLKPFHRIAPADWQREMDINVTGAFRCLQWAYPALKKAGPPASALLFSTVAVQTGMPFHASIAAAKGAVEGLTRALAAEWAPTIRVNAIAPSLTDTPLASALLSSPEKRESAAQRHPLKKIGSAQEIAEAGLFLLSEKASFLTGQIITIDGGIGTLR